MQYKAFISYSHAADNMLAPILQGSLQNFSKPFYKVRNFRIFRDKTTLSLTPELWPLIQHSLQDSEHFIFLASPVAASSKWVTKEINEWLSIHNDSLDKFLIILTDGTIAWNDSRQDFDWEKTTALPSCLQNKFKHEPLYSDLRWATKTTDLSLRHPQFLDEIGSIASILLNRPKDAIIGEDVRQHRNFKRITSATIALLLLLLSGSLVAAYIANRQSKIANYQTAVARHQKQIADSQRIEATSQRNYAEAQRKLVQVTADSLQIANKLAGERQSFAEQQQAIAQKRQREAEYMLGESFVRQGDIPKAVALFAKISTNLHHKQINPEYSTVLQYYLPRLNTIQETLEEYEKPVVFNWRGGNYFMSQDGIPKFISNTLITDWSVNHCSTRLITLEDNRNAVLRTLPDMKVLKRYDFTGSEIGLIADNKIDNEFFLVGKYKTASIGSVWPLLVHLSYNGTISDTFDSDEDPTIRKRFEDTDTLNNLRMLVINPTFPKCSDEATKWHSVPLSDFHTNTQERRSRNLSPIDSMHISKLQSSLEYKCFVKSRDDKYFFDLLKDHQGILFAATEYKYRNDRYLIGTTNDMGQQGSHLFILKIENGKITNHKFIEIGVEAFQFYTEDNLMYLANNVYPSRDAFIMFDFNSFRQLIPDVSPLMDGPDRNGLAYNNSKNLVALISNYENTFDESSDSEDDSTNAEGETMIENTHDTDETHSINEQILAKGNLSNGSQDISDSLQFKNLEATEQIEMAEMGAEETEEGVPQKGASDLWIYQLDYTASRMRRVWRNRMRSQINNLKFASDNVLIVTTKDNGLSALDCISFRTLWTIHNPLNDTTDKVTKVETDKKTGVVAAFNKNRICLYLAKTGLPLSEIYTLGDTAAHQADEIKNVWFSSNGDLQVQYGNKCFRRESFYSKQKFTRMFGTIENLTGVSSKDGLTEKKRVFYKK